MKESGRMSKEELFEFLDAKNPRILDKTDISMITIGFGYIWNDGCGTNHEHWEYGCFRSTIASGLSHMEEPEPDGEGDFEPRPESFDIKFDLNARVRIPKDRDILIVFGKAVEIVDLLRGEPVYLLNTKEHNLSEFYNAFLDPTIDELSLYLYIPKRDYSVRVEKKRKYHRRERQLVLER